MGQGEERGIGIIGEGFPKGERPIGREFSDQAIGKPGRSFGFDIIGISDAFGPALPDWPDNAGSWPVAGLPDA